MIYTDVGFDPGKQIHGRKRFITVDLLGLVLRVLFTYASVPKRARLAPARSGTLAELTKTRKTSRNNSTIINRLRRSICFPASKPTSVQIMVAVSTDWLSKAASYGLGSRLAATRTH